MNRNGKFLEFDTLSALFTFLDRNYTMKKMEDSRPFNSNSYQLKIYGDDVGLEFEIRHDGESD